MLCGLPPAAQVCGSILMKLVMDLFLNAGPGTSYPLVLRMLRQSLSSPQPKVRTTSPPMHLHPPVHLGAHCSTRCRHRACRPCATFGPRCAHTGSLCMSPPCARCALLRRCSFCECDCLVHTNPLDCVWRTEIHYTC